MGEAIAASVADYGGRPLVVDRTKPAADVAFAQVDLADAESERAIRAAVEEIGGVDAVVTAAGIDSCGPLSDVAADDWERVIAVNLVGTARTVRACLPSLTERRGRVVTIASTLGWRALPDATAYCASKFGVVGFTRALAAEMAGCVDVTLLLPGGMNTHFFDGRPEQYKPAADAKLADPMSVAASVVFALSQPEGCHVRELMVTGTSENSWP